MNTNGPTLATAWRQRRVRSSPVSVAGAGVIQLPPEVSSMTVLVASSTCAGAQHTTHAITAHFNQCDGGLQ